MRCLCCLSLCRWLKTDKHSCRSSVISMRSYPPQYPRCSTPVKPFPFLFLSFSPPPLFSSFFFFLSSVFGNSMCRPMMTSNIQNQKFEISFTRKYIKWNKVKYVRIHVHEYTERMFASTLPRQYSRQTYLDKQIPNKTWRWWQATTPFPIPAPWPWRPPAIETPPRPVPAGPLISWPSSPRTHHVLGFWFSNSTPAPLVSTWELLIPRDRLRKNKSKITTWVRSLWLSKFETFNTMRAHGPIWDELRLYIREFSFWWPEILSGISDV